MECECQKDCHPSEQEVMKHMEKVLYQLPGEIVYGTEEELLDCDGQLVGVYTLSHFARVKTEPKRVTLRIVAIE